MEYKNEYTAWERFHGYGTGGISNEELIELFNQAKAALPFLNSNRKDLGSLACGHALRVLGSLANYAQARGLDGDFSF